MTGNDSETSDGTGHVQESREAGASGLFREPESAVNPAKPARQSCPADTRDEDLGVLFALVKARTGQDFGSYKRNTVMRRIERRMTAHQSDGLRSYISFLEHDSREADILAREILIGVTKFFRDPEAFEVLRTEVIPRLFDDRDPEDPVRVWHACCASGEEAYSVAMLLREHMERERPNARVQVFATDIDDAAVAQARSGLYPEDIGPDVGEERLKSFFTRTMGRWQAAKELRDMILFAGHNLIKDPPFSRLDLLVCRNFLIYLKPDMQKRLMSLFHLVLKPGGFLFLGASETTGTNSDLFVPVDKKWKIYRRREGGIREDIIFPFTTTALKTAVEASATMHHHDAPSPGVAADRLLVERYCPPCVVVNERYEVLHISSRTRHYLEVPVGAPSLDILKMAREELRAVLRAALHESFAARKKLAFRGVKLDDDGGDEAVNLTVEPLAAHPSYGRLALVILEPDRAQDSIPHLGDEEVLPEDECSRRTLFRQMEEQLRITHEQLRFTTEQLEASNEGFLATNEELMSINEEFQSANEELQSTNEELEASKRELQALNLELTAVNAKLQEKKEEWERTFDSVPDLIAILDGQHRIVRVNRAMAERLGTTPEACFGLPCHQNVHHSGQPPKSCPHARTLADGREHVAEIRAEHLGGDFLVSTTPLRDAAGRMLGTVHVARDITGQKRMEHELRESEQRLKRSQEIAHLGSWELNLAENRLTWSDETYRIFGLRPGEFEASYEAFLEAVHPEDRAAVDAAYSGSLDDGKDSYEIEHRIVRKDNGEIRIVHEKCEHFRDDNGRLLRSVGMVHDITERKLSEQRIIRNMEELERFNRVAVGRELRMVELKREVNELRARLGESPRYPMDFLDDETDN